MIVRRWYWGLAFMMVIGGGDLYGARRVVHVERESSWVYLDMLTPSWQVGGPFDYPVDGAGRGWLDADYDVLSSVEPTKGVKFDWYEGPGPLGNGSISCCLYQTEIQGPTGIATLVNTHLFRGEFDVGDLGEAFNLNVDLLVDDGGILYINGVEVDRYQMPEGVITTDTFATRHGYEGGYVTRVGLDAGVLREGVNTIAYEVHQLARVSEDVMFDLELYSVVPEPGVLGGMLVGVMIGFWRRWG